jgi:hypothetical protein
MVDELGGNDGQREKSEITMRARKKERRKMEREEKRKTAGKLERRKHCDKL